MIQSHTPFEGSNLFATHITTYGKQKRYVVYSYGTHFPLFIYDESTDTWFENGDKYSPTTARHRSQAHPQPTKGTILLSTQWMKTLADRGFMALAKARILGGHNATENM